MTLTLRRLALAGMMLAGFAGTATAQSPTPEGTVITNTATATWTDANGNTYTPATASASVTVGFLAGPDVTSPVSVTPASPSTGNELPFTITNSGNGVDSVSVSPTVGSGVTITGYKVGSVTYTTLAEVNEALAGTAIPAGGSVTVTIIYTVAPGQGGQTIPASLTATSRRTPSTTDSSTTNIIPTVSAGVNVTPDNGAVSRLPSNGTQYTATYTIENTGNRSDTYSLAALANPGSAVTIVSVNGTAGSSGSITVSSGASTTVNVVYTVGDVAAGTTDDLRLTATSGNNAATSDVGNYVVTVIRAAITMTKEVFRDNQTTAIGASDRVLPGEYIQYRITVTNAGAAAAVLTGSGYGISDPLPSQVTYVSSAGDAAGWTLSESSGTVSATLTGTLAPAASRYFWIRVRVN
jgi:hypothetical protein